MFSGPDRGPAVRPGMVVVAMNVKKIGQDNLFSWAMCAPALGLFTVFVVFPFVYSIYISLFRWDGFGEMFFMGLRNYGFVFQDKVFWLAYKNTAIYAVGVTLIKNITGLALAMVIRRAFVGRTAFRVVMFLPVTFSYVTIGVLWSWVYNPFFGLLNNCLDMVGLSMLKAGWLSDPKIALFSVMVVDIWKWSGFHMVLYLAGLQNIPGELFEAARIDGANPRQEFVRITVPQLNGVIAINVLLSMTGAFVANYDLVNIMTGGGPFHSTEVLLTHIIYTGFQMNTLGKANAMSFMLFILVLIFGLLQMRSMSKDSNYES
jgi:ABC-type sugar transport system permease subunit